MDLTEDERLVLEIASADESLAAIGRWEKPIDRLVALGLMERRDKFNNVITAAGREALMMMEIGDEAALRELIGLTAPMIDGEVVEKEE